MQKFFYDASVARVNTVANFNSTDTKLYESIQNELVDQIDSVVNKGKFRIQYATKNMVPEHISMAIRLKLQSRGYTVIYYRSMSDDIWDISWGI